MDNKKSQKYLLIGFEKLVGEVHPQLLAKVPHILKAFYDEDILEEESILEWADKASCLQVNYDVGMCMTVDMELPLMYGAESGRNIASGIGCHTFYKPIASKENQEFYRDMYRKPKHTDAIYLARYRLHVT